TASAEGPPRQASGRSGEPTFKRWFPPPNLLAKSCGGESSSPALHCECGAAECVRSLIPGALSILKGAVPGRARGFGHMAPTYFRREPGIVAPTAFAAPHFSPWPVSMADLYGRRFMADGDPSISALKADLRRAAQARRDALSPSDRMAAA